MKKIMLAAVAASFMTTGAHAIQLPAEGEACSTIHSNISVGINNPELSDYRKCVMIQHDIDTAFTYKTFWVRTGTEFTSFPVASIAKLSKTERIAFIKESIHKEIVIKLLEDQSKLHADQILKLQAQFADIRESLIAEHAKRLQEIMAAKADVDRLLEMLNDEKSQLMADLTDKKTHVETLEGEVQDLKDRIDVLENTPPTIITRTEFVTDPATFNNGYSAGIYDSALALVEGGVYKTISEAESALNDGYAYSDLAYMIRNAKTTKEERDNLFGAVNVLATGILSADKINELGDGVGANAVTHVMAVLNAISEAADIEAMKRAALDAEPAIVVYAYDLDNYPTRVVVKDGAFTAATLINGFDNTIPDDLADNIEEAFKQGYSDGFEDGYEQGYADGYSDGYSDGVNSVGS